jgi:hypothetical protein
VRFFSHLSSAEELQERWREYLEWFPEWPLPEKSAPSIPTTQEEDEGAAAAAHSRAEAFTSRGAHQWTYEKSPAYLGLGAAPMLAHLLLPSVKVRAWMESMHSLYISRCTDVNCCCSLRLPSLLSFPC